MGEHRDLRWWYLCPEWIKSWWIQDVNKACGGVSTVEGGTPLEEIVLGWGVLGDSVLSWSFLLLLPSAYCLPFCELFPHTFGWDETRSQNSYFLPLTYSANCYFSAITGWHTAQKWRGLTRLSKTQHQLTKITNYSLRSFGISYKISLLCHD